MSSASFAQALLDHWGVRVTPIPTSDDEQSDFLAKLGRSSFLIEEKTKMDDPARLRERSDILSEGRIHTAARPIVRSNRLSGIVKKAVGQLASSAQSYDHNFRLIWFTGTGHEAQAHYHQFIATLYGTTNVWEMNGGMTPCYFFRNNEFHRYSSELDGAVAACVSQGKLSARFCVNPLSPGAQSLRRTKFVKLFGTAVEDPTRLERSRGAYILDSATDRTDEDALLAELQRKYRTRPLMKFDMGYLSATVAVRADER